MSIKCYCRWTTERGACLYDYVNKKDGEIKVCTSCDKQTNKRGYDIMKFNQTLAVYSLEGFPEDDKSEITKLRQSLTLRNDDSAYDELKPVYNTLDDYDERSR